MTNLSTFLSIPMSILTTEQYLQDADCPELCDNDAFTIIDCKDADEDFDEEWDDMLSRAFKSDMPFDVAMGMYLSDY